MAELPELTVRVEQVEKGLEREIGKREQSDKYNHRLIEDVQKRYQDTALMFGRIETAFTQHLKDDREMAQSFANLDGRLRTVERLAWVAVGGLAVIASLVTIFGSHAIGMVK
jgi:hypothetical protein